MFFFFLEFFSVERWNDLSSPFDYEKRLEWNTTLSLERLIERVGAFTYGIYVKLINESYFPFHRQRRNDLTEIHIGSQLLFEHFPFKFVMRGQLLLLLNERSNEMLSSNLERKWNDNRKSRSNK